MDFFINCVSESTVYGQTCINKGDWNFSHLEGGPRLSLRGGNFVSLGDADNDGDVDYVANGGWIYFNPGEKHVRQVNKWVKMTLFEHERRVPRVFDMDGDGLNDLVVTDRELLALRNLFDRMYSRYPFLVLPPLFVLFARVARVCLTFTPQVAFYYKTCFVNKIQRII